MKRTICLMLIMSLGISGVCWAGKTASTPQLNVKAGIRDEFGINLWVQAITPGSQPGERDENVDPYGSGTAAWTGGLDFGDFTYAETIEGSGADMAVFRSWTPQRYFCVFVSAYTQGLPYKITQTCNASGLEQTLLLTTDYSAYDKMGYFPQDIIPVPDQGVAGEDVLQQQGVVEQRGIKRFAVGESVPIYTSNNTPGFIAKPRIVRCWYGLATGDDLTPWGESIPSNKSPEPVGAKTIDKLLPGTYEGSVTFTVTQL